MRACGKITNDLEKLLTELTDDHDLQAYEITGIIWNWIVAHRPESLDWYDDGKHCVMYVGHPEQIKINIEE